jgi:hypothetical protein
MKRKRKWRNPQKSFYFQNSTNKNPHTYVSSHCLLYGTQLTTCDGLFNPEISCSNFPGLAVHVSLRALVFFARVLGEGSVRKCGKYVGYSLANKASELSTPANHLFCLHTLHKMLAFQLHITIRPQTSLLHVAVSSTAFPVSISVLGTVAQRNNGSFPRCQDYILSTSWHSTSPGNKSSVREIAAHIPPLDKLQKLHVERGFMYSWTSFSLHGPW